MFSAKDLQGAIDLACSGAGISMLTLLDWDEVVRDTLANQGVAILDAYEPADGVTVYELAGARARYLTELEHAALHAAWATEEEPTPDQFHVAVGLALIQLRALRHELEGCAGPVAGVTMETLWAPRRRVH